MEPTLPSPHGAPEMAPTMPKAPETIPYQAGGEFQPSLERPAPAEQKTGGGTDNAGAPPPMPSVPIPPAASSAVPTPTTVVADDSPAVAADEDLIEKEWVEKAKKVISETKHDPYAQEQAISRLQADYLNKRYGKVIKLPRED